MLWPDVVQDMRDKIDAAVVAGGFTDCPVYLGRFTRVPNKDAIYIWAGDSGPEGLMCARESLDVSVAVWTRAENPNTSTEDVTHENEHVYASWSRLSQISKLIKALDFSGSGYTTNYTDRQSDGCRFHPSAGELIRFTAAYGV